ncbi:MAG: hypothetical protein IM638_09990 [Bacteroidetes bacterium]|nr:hypothetical protein [Bacteroidota bacterium]
MLLQRIKAFFLLLIILVQCAGLQIWAGWQLGQYRAAMRKACKAIQPHLRFTPAQLKQARWIHAHEFELNGKRYDVARVEQTDSGIVYHAISDSREDRMRAQEKLLHTQDESSRPAQKIVLKKLTDYSPATDAVSLPPLFLTGKTSFDLRPQASHGLRPVPPDPPPPRTVQC